MDTESFLPADIIADIQQAINDAKKYYFVEPVAVTNYLAKF